MNLKAQISLEQLRAIQSIGKTAVFIQPANESVVSSPVPNHMRLGVSSALNI
jgi:hypothetical protein